MVAHRKIVLFLSIFLQQYVTAEEAVCCHYSFVDHYLSYPCTNDFGGFDHCLRAAQDLVIGTVVASSDFEKTENPFIALHESTEFRHVAIAGFKKDGSIQWGKVRGKMALINHACNPNCELLSDGTVRTIMPVQKGQELAIAYDAPIEGVAWDPAWDFKCLCNAHNCRLNIDSYDYTKSTRQLSIVD